MPRFLEHRRLFRASRDIVARVTVDHATATAPRRRRQRPRFDEVASGNAAAPITTASTPMIQQVHAAPPKPE